MLFPVNSSGVPIIHMHPIAFVLKFESLATFQAPLLRWKQHAFLAALCIIFVRAVLVQLAFFAHMQVANTVHIYPPNYKCFFVPFVYCLMVLFAQQHVLKRPLAPTRSVVFATCFMCCFSAVIALFKVCILNVKIKAFRYVCLFDTGIHQLIFFIYV